jgi:hypothetical protein
VTERDWQRLIERKIDWESVRETDRDYQRLADRERFRNRAKEEEKTYIDEGLESRVLVLEFGCQFESFFVCIAVLMIAQHHLCHLHEHISKASDVVSMRIRSCVCFCVWLCELRRTTDHNEREREREETCTSFFETCLEFLVKSFVHRIDEVHVAEELKEFLSAHHILLPSQSLDVFLKREKREREQHKREIQCR